MTSVLCRIILCHMVQSYATCSVFKLERQNIIAIFSLPWNELCMFHDSNLSWKLQLSLQMYFYIIRCLNTYTLYVYCIVEISQLMVLVVMLKSFSVERGSPAQVLQVNLLLCFLYLMTCLWRCLNVFFSFLCLGINNICTNMGCDLGNY